MLSGEKTVKFYHTNISAYNKKQLSKEAVSYLLLLNHYRFREEGFLLLFGTIIIYFLTVPI